MNDSLTQIQTICQHGIALAEKATSFVSLQCKALEVLASCRLGDGDRTVYEDINGAIDTIQKLYSATTLLPAALTALQEAVAALESITKQCSCSVAERDSGHRAPCFVPEVQDLLARIAASLTAAQTP